MTNKNNLVHASGKGLELNGWQNCDVAAQKVIIDRSWKRCTNDYALDPSQINEVCILTRQELNEHKIAIEEFLNIAKKGMLQLYKKIAYLNYSILLTDVNGVTVVFNGKDRFDNKLKSTGIYLGSVWQEKISGTNAVGVCIAEKMPVTVHRDEHFYMVHKSLTCTAVPIFDPMGNFLAVLDVSALSSPEYKNSQHLLMQLVLMHAQYIEYANFHHHFRDKWIIQLSTIKEYANVCAENIIAIDDEGIICGANKNAKLIFADNLLDVGFGSKTIVGKSIREYFLCDLGNLFNVGANSRDIVMLRTLNPQKTFYSVIKPPIVKKNKPTRKKQQAYSMIKIAGGDPVMEKNITQIKLLVNSNVNILLLGETGTGKEVLAKTIHAESIRANKPFVPVNCVAIPESLIESELFGYKPGAFTGARNKGRVGLIQQSDGGTLFLDEIGDMPFQLQTRLLRVLSENEVMPLGANKPIAVELNVIAATHADINQLMKERKFRQDLYFRLCGSTLQIPALRDRKDKEFIINNIVLSESGNSNVCLSIDAMELLLNYDWPGNIRELCNVIRVAIAMSKQDIITYDDIPDDLKVRNKNSSFGEPISKPYSTRELYEYSQYPLKIQKLILTLQNNKWNITDTARELKSSRATLYRNMKRYKIILPNIRDPKSP